MKSKQVLKIVSAIRDLVKSEHTDTPGCVGNSGVMLVKLGFAIRLGHANHSLGRYVRFKVTQSGLDFAAKNAGALPCLVEHVKRKIGDVPDAKLLNYVSPICGIYFLLRGDEVVYVGKSIDILHRVQRHKKENTKAFDSVRYVEVDEVDLAIEEERWIKFFQPVENRASTEWNSSRQKSSELNRLCALRHEFGTPTILDLALSGEEKEYLVSVGILTVRKLYRNKLLAKRFESVLERFAFHGGVAL